MTSLGKRMNKQGDGTEKLLFKRDPFSSLPVHALSGSLNPRHQVLVSLKLSQEHGLGSVDP